VKLSADFERHEFACPCGCGFDTADTALVGFLQRARDHIDEPLHVTNGCRCPTYNAEVDGAPNSLHIFARAADVWAKRTPARVLQQLFVQWGAPGVGGDRRYTHIDTRTGPIWRSAHVLAVLAEEAR